jgi:hypothetical protein
MQVSSWKMTQDQPGERLSLTGFWPPNAPRGLSVDKSTQQITVRPLWGEATTINFSSLRGLRFLIGRESGQRLRLQLSILHKEDNEPRTTSLSFRVKALDRHEEALDLIFRVAQIVGWSSYLLYQRDEHGIELELRPESHDPFRSDAQANHEAPEIKAPADYHFALLSTKSLYELTRQDPLRPKFYEPSKAATPLDPTSHPAVVTWDPPQKITLHRSPSRTPLGAFFYLSLGLPLTIAGWILLYVMGVVGSLSVGLMAASMLLLALNWISHSFAVFAFEHSDILLGLAALVAGACGLFSLWSMLGNISHRVLLCFSHQVSLDLDQGTFTLTRARIFWSRWKLSHITSITLARCHSGIKNLFTKKRKITEGDSWYEVQAKVGLFRVQLWQGKEEEIPKYEEARSLAVALARALDVPFREE